MPLEVQKYLEDMRQALEKLERFTQGKALEDYLGDELLRAAVERQFEVIGEALGQLAKRDESVAARVSDYRRIIAFRNILIHNYTVIDDRVVWDIVAFKVPTLRREIEQLLESVDR